MQLGADAITKFLSWTNTHQQDITQQDVKNKVIDLDFGILDPDGAKLKIQFDGFGSSDIKTLPSKKPYSQGFWTCDEHDVKSLMCCRYQQLAFAFGRLQTMKNDVY